MADMKVSAIFLWPRISFASDAVKLHVALARWWERRIA
jgi:hypothetical protein